MQTRETIGIAMMAIGFASSFFVPAGLLAMLAGAFVYGKNRLAMILFAFGLRMIFQSGGLAGGVILAPIGAVLLAKSHYFPFGFALTQSGRRKINPFTGKKHHNRVDDDKFLKDAAGQYYGIVNRS